MVVAAMSSGPRTDVFSMLFTPGHEIATKKTRFVVSVPEIGPLHLPTGRVVTGDAIGTLTFEPLTRLAPPGVFPVEASLVRVSPRESRIAAVRVVYSRRPVTSWEIADGGSGATTRSASGAPGYTGPLGLLIDAQTVGSLQAYIDSSDGEWWYDPPKSRGDAWEYACFQPDEDRDETCVFFQTGNGDGVFTSYWGLDADGEPAVLVTDFNVIP
jgi:hypothetical protein